MLLHFIEGSTSERAGRLKLPVTLGAAEALKILALNPIQTAWHLRIIAPRCAKRNSATLPACKESLADDRMPTSMPVNAD
jgi:hypothetical protein